MFQPQSLDMANQVIVTIAVKNRKLSYYPRRDNDVIVYAKDPERGHPEKPDQVRWVATGLESDNQFLLIQAKKTNPAGPIFPFPEYRLTRISNTTVSGVPQVRPPDHGETRWGYSITLMEGDKVVDTIDPLIIVKNDP